MTAKPRATLAMESARLSDVYPAEALASIDELATLDRPFVTAEDLTNDPSMLAETEVLLTGWGAPILDSALLAAAPKLRLVLVAAGSVKSITPPEFWATGIPIASAAAANAEPVADFAHAHITLALKRAHMLGRRIRSTGEFPSHEGRGHTLGNTVGLLSLGEVGQRVARRIAAPGLTVLAHDPFIDPANAAKLGVELVSLDELFERSEALCVLTPLLPQTTGLVTAALLRRLPDSATLINVARGAIVNEPQLIEVLGEREDLTAVLDVTWPEPPLAGSPLYTLDNVVLTPHIAGSLGRERAAMGRLVADELRRFARGEPLEHAISPGTAALRA